MTASTDLIGCHISTAGGLHEAFARADATGARVMQIFTANQRSWKAPTLTDAQVAQFKAARQASQVVHVMSHDSYLVNLCSPKDDVRAKSLGNFVDEYRRCTRLGIEELNFHPGSHMGAELDAALQLVADGMRAALDAEPTSATLLLVEITAGQGTNLGHTLEEVAALLDLAGSPARVGVCVDTAHAYAAGYDLKGEAGYRQFFTQFDAAIGLERLKAFHLNDSKPELGSRVDRHACIGKGNLGEATFARLVRDERFARVPMFLETPEEELYAEEIALLKRLRAGK